MTGFTGALATHYHWDLEKLTEWAKWLRNPRFKQGDSLLWHGGTDKYCCLGVACVQASELGGIPLPWAGSGDWAGWVAPSDAVNEWFATGSRLVSLGALSLPFPSPNPETSQSGTARYGPIAANDGQGKTFDQIADAIDRLVREHYNLRMLDWADMLDSGDFEQGTQMLYTQDGKYCCLGVACVLANQKADIPLPWEGTDGWQRIGLPPYRTQHFFDDALMQVGLKFPDHHDDGVGFSGANDSLGKTFPEIAQAIRDYVAAQS